MNLHSRAKLTPRSRAELIHRVLDLEQPVAAVAAALGVSARTAFKWLARFRAEGHAGLRDRSSRPKCSPRITHPRPGSAPQKAAGLSDRPRGQALQCLRLPLPPPPCRQARLALAAAADPPL